MKKIGFNTKKGFTLAEVLITLGIIGVVAALTVPTLIQNSQTAENVSKLKKVYSTLSNAYTLAVQENGTPDTWNLDAPASSVGAQEMINKLASFLNITKNCGISANCMAPGGYTRLKTNGIWDTNGLNYVDQIQLSDGTLLVSYVDSNTCTWSMGSTSQLSNMCGEYHVDINGLRKPNKLGVDLFTFYLTKYGIMPEGSQQETNQFANQCNNDGASGWGCAAWVIYNENMDYLKCNTLSWNGPTKCN